MPAGDVTQLLEARVRDLAGDNAASFTATRIYRWMEEAQLDLVRRLPPSAIPEMIEQASGSTDSSGTVALPSDYINPVAMGYGTSDVPATFKDQEIFRSYKRNTYMALAADPVWTFQDGKIAFAPAVCAAYKLDYVRKCCPALSATQDPEIPTRYQDALVMYAAAKCEQRQKAFDEANVHMSEYERAVTLWGGTQLQRQGA